MDQSVGTSKPRFSITVEPQLHKALEEYCNDNFVSKSELIEKFLSIYFSMPIEKQNQLEELARSECRGLTEQIQFLLYQALKD